MHGEGGACVCVCVCVRACVCVCARMCVSAGTYVRAYVCVCLCVRACEIEASRFAGSRHNVAVLTGRRSRRARAEVDLSAMVNRSVRSAGICTHIRRRGTGRSQIGEACDGTHTRTHARTHTLFSSGDETEQLEMLAHLPVSGA